MKHEVPCLYGYFLNSGSVAEFSKRVTPILESLDKRLAVFEQGISSELLVAKSIEGISLLRGRVYDPVQVNSGVTDAVNAFDALLERPIQDWDGNYVLLRYSEHDGQLTLDVDRFASRQWLYYIHSSGLYFSTHLAGILKCLKNPKVDRNSFRHFVFFGQIPNASSLVKRVQKIRPEHQLLCRSGQIDIIKNKGLDNLYLANKYYRNSGDLITDVAGQIGELLAESVRRRTRGLSTVGLTLSGGLDSGIVALHLKKAGVQIEAFNVAYEHGYNEFDRLEIFSAKYGIAVNRVVVQPKDIIDNYLLREQFASEPLGFNSALLGHLSESAISAGATTVFEGGGADHLFMGMNRYRQYFQVWRAYRCVKKLGLARPLAALFLKSNSTERKKLGILFSNWNAGIPPYPKRHYITELGYNADLEAEIFSYQIEEMWNYYKAEFAGADLGLLFTLITILMDPEEHFLPPTEQQAPFGGFPISPFWSPELVSLALSLPLQMKVKGKTTKYILRRAAELEMDRDYLNLPKVGLQDSFTYLTKTPLGKEWIDDLVDKIYQDSEYTSCFGEQRYRNVAEKLIPYYFWKKQYEIN